MIINATLYGIYEVSYVCINKSLTMKSTSCDKKEEKRKELRNKYN